MYILVLIELEHDNTNKMMCAQRRHRSASSSTQSSLSAWRRFGSLATHIVHCEDSDQTGHLPRWIWAFAGRTANFVGFVMLRLKREIVFPNMNQPLICDCIWTDNWICSSLSQVICHFLPIMSHFCNKDSLQHSYLKTGK